MKRGEDLVPRNYQILGIPQARWLSRGALGPGREIRKRDCQAGQSSSREPHCDCSHAHILVLPGLWDSAPRGPEGSLLSGFSFQA